MMPNSAFVTTTNVIGLSSFRRPQLQKCNCAQHFPTTLRKRYHYSSLFVRMSTQQPPNPNQSSSSDLQRNASSFIASPQKGFALRDAPVISFSDLDENKELLSTGGAYAIRDEMGQIMYMGYSKNIASKLSFHSDLLPDQCASFQVYVPPVPPELISADMLENVLEYWVRENGTLPKGNTADRHLWEQQDTPKKKKNTNPSPTNSTNEDVPIRNRTTPRRVSTRSNSTQYYGQQKASFTDSFTQSARKSTSSKSNDDYVQVDVDPFDPFSASSRRPNFGGSWDAPDFTDDQTKEDWLPILLLMGTAGLIWLCGILTTSIPASNPTMGM